MSSVPSANNDAVVSYLRECDNECAHILGHIIKVFNPVKINRFCDAKILLPLTKIRGSKHQLHHVCEFMVHQA